MIFISWIFVTFSFISLISGIYILSINRKNRINILFALICFDLAIIFFIENLNNYIPDKDHAIILYYSILFFTNIFFPLNVHFLYKLTKDKFINYMQFILIYAPSLLMTIFSIIFHFPWSDLIRTNNQYWRPVSATDNAGFYFYIAYGFIYLGICLMLLFKWRKKSGSQKIKRQAAVMIAGLLFFLISGFILNLILQATSSYKLPPLSILTVSLYLFSILYSLTKYRFLSMDTKLVLDEILSNIDEFVFLLDTDLNIIQANNISKRYFLKDNKNEFHFLNIIGHDEYLNKTVNELITGNCSELKQLIIYKKENKLVFTDSYLTRLEDKFNDPLAILVISRQNKIFNEFKKNYKITNRELEIIYLTMLGFSSKEIGVKLGISARTIDHHHIHIYNKLNINNKKDLIKLINRKESGEIRSFSELIHKRIRENML